MIDKLGRLSIPISITVGFFCLLLGAFFVDMVNSSENECATGRSYHEFHTETAPQYDAEYFDTLFEPDVNFEAAAKIESQVVPGLGFSNNGVPEDYVVKAYKSPNNPESIIAVVVLPNSCLYELVKISEVYWATKIDD